MDYHVIAWDFDGVLNQTFQDGQFCWCESFEEDLGVSLSSFLDFMFSGNYQKAMVGKADLHQLVGKWAEAEGFSGKPEFVVAYMFEKDARPDQHMLSILKQAARKGVKNVIATNNDPYRTAYIESTMGFGSLVDHLFAAGRMGVAKPDDGFFTHIQNVLGVSPDKIVLVDDARENVVAARRLGWKAHHFVEDGYDQLRIMLDL